MCWVNTQVSSGLPVAQRDVGAVGEEDQTLSLLLELVHLSHRQGTGVWS